MFRSSMQVARRFAGMDLDLIADAGMAITGVTLDRARRMDAVGRRGHRTGVAEGGAASARGGAAGAAPPSAAHHVDRAYGRLSRSNTG